MKAQSTHGGPSPTSLDGAQFLPPLHIVSSSAPDAPALLAKDPIRTWLSDGCHSSVLCIAPPAAESRSHRVSTPDAAAAAALELLLGLQDGSVLMECLRAGLAAGCAGPGPADTSRLALWCGELSWGGSAARGTAPYVPCRWRNLLAEAAAGVMGTEAAAAGAAGDDARPQSGRVRGAAAGASPGAAPLGQRRAAAAGGGGAAAAAAAAGAPLCAASAREAVAVLHAAFQRSTLWRRQRRGGGCGGCGSGCEPTGAGAGSAAAAPSSASARSVGPCGGACVGAAVAPQPLLEPAAGGLDSGVLFVRLGVPLAGRAAGGARCSAAAPAPSAAPGSSGHAPPRRGAAAAAASASDGGEGCGVGDAWTTLDVVFIGGPVPRGEPRGQRAAAAADCGTVAGSEERVPGHHGCVRGLLTELIARQSDTTGIPHPLRSAGGAAGCPLCSRLAPLLAGNVSPHLLAVVPAAAAAAALGGKGKGDAEEHAPMLAPPALELLQLLSSAQAIRTVVARTELPPPLYGSSAGGGDFRGGGGGVGCRQLVALLVDQHTREVRRAEAKATEAAAAAAAASAASEGAGPPATTVLSPERTLHGAQEAEVAQAHITASTAQRGEAGGDAAAFVAVTLPCGMDGPKAGGPGAEILGSKAAGAVGNPDDATATRRRGAGPPSPPPIMAADLDGVDAGEARRTATAPLPCSLAPLQRRLESLQRSNARRACGGAEGLAAAATTAAAQSEVPGAHLAPSPPGRRPSAATATPYGMSNARQCMAPAADGASAPTAAAAAAAAAAAPPLAAGGRADAAAAAVRLQSLRAQFDQLYFGLVPEGLRERPTQPSPDDTAYGGAPPVPPQSALPAAQLQPQAGGNGWLPPGQGPASAAAWLARASAGDGDASLLFSPPRGCRDTTAGTARRTSGPFPVAPAAAAAAAAAPAAGPSAAAPAVRPAPAGPTVQALLGCLPPRVRPPQPDAPRDPVPVAPPKAATTQGHSSQLTCGDAGRARMRSVSPGSDGRGRGCPGSLDCGAAIPSSRRQISGRDDVAEGGGAWVPAGPAPPPPPRPAPGLQSIVMAGYASQWRSSIAATATLLVPGGNPGGDVLHGRAEAATGRLRPRPGPEAEPARFDMSVSASPRDARPGHQKWQGRAAQGKGRRRVRFGQPAVSPRAEREIEAPRRRSRQQAGHESYAAADSGGSGSHSPRTSDDGVPDGHRDSGSCGDAFDINNGSGSDGRDGGGPGWLQEVPVGRYAVPAVSGYASLHPRAVTETRRPSCGAPARRDLSPATAGHEAAVDGQGEKGEKGEAAGGAESPGAVYARRWASRAGRTSAGVGAGAGAERRQPERATRWLRRGGVRGGRAYGGGRGGGDGSDSSSNCSSSATSGVGSGSRGSGGSVYSGGGGGKGDGRGERVLSGGEDCRSGHESSGQHSGGSDGHGDREVSADSDAGEQRHSGQRGSGQRGRGQRGSDRDSDGGGDSDTVRAGAAGRPGSGSGRRQQKDQEDPERAIGGTSGEPQRDHASRQSLSDIHAGAVDADATDAADVVAAGPPPVPASGGGDPACQTRQQHRHHRSLSSAATGAGPTELPAERRAHSNDPQHSHATRYPVADSGVDPTATAATAAAAAAAEGATLRLRDQNSALLGVLERAAAGSEALQGRLYGTQLEVLELRAALDVQRAEHAAQLAALRRHMRRAAEAAAAAEDGTAAAAAAKAAAAGGGGAGASGGASAAAAAGWGAGPGPAAAALEALVGAYEEQIQGLQRQVADLVAGEGELAAQLAEQELAAAAQRAARRRHSCDGGELLGAAAAASRAVQRPAPPLRPHGAWGSGPHTGSSGGGACGTSSDSDSGGSSSGDGREWLLQLPTDAEVMRRAGLELPGPAPAGAGSGSAVGGGGGDKAWLRSRQEFGCLRGALRRSAAREAELREALAAAQRGQRAALLAARLAAGEGAARRRLELEVAALRRQLASAREGSAAAAAARDTAHLECLRLRTEAGVLTAELGELRRAAGAYAQLLDRSNDWIRTATALPPPAPPAPAPRAGA